MLRSLHGIIASSIKRGWDISNAVYDNISFDVSGQTSSPRSVAFKSDGTKMYISDPNTANVYQYTLSTAWDISTATYDNVSFSFASQEATGAKDITFASNGTKLFMLGFSTYTIFQYTLSTAWDISTATYDNVSFDPTTQAGIMMSLQLKDDGTKLYVLGSAVYQYTLSTSFNVGTATYDNVSFSFASQDSVPFDIFFKPDGTKIYMLGANNDTAYQYTLGTAWNVGTITYDSISFSVAGQDTFPRDIALRTDNGTKMYILGELGLSVFQYSL